MFCPDTAGFFTKNNITFILSPWARSNGLMWKKNQILSYLYAILLMKHLHLSLPWASRLQPALSGVEGLDVTEKQSYSKLSLTTDLSVRAQSRTNMTSRLSAVLGISTSACPERSQRTRRDRKAVRLKVIRLAMQWKFKL